MAMDLRSKLSLSNPWHFLALGFGTGLAPKAPGTFGSLAAIPLYLLMMPLSWPLYLALTLVALLLGVVICQKASAAMGVHDHPAIVWDEVVGMLITLFLAPPGWLWILAGFVIFRFFDIVKPWPIGWLDRKVHGGLGIMLDDVMAGLMSLAVMQLLAAWLL